MSRRVPTENTANPARDPARLMRLVIDELGTRAPNHVSGAAAGDPATPIGKDQFEQLVQHLVAEYHAMPHATVGLTHEHLIWHVHRRLASAGLVQGDA